MFNFDYMVHCWSENHYNTSHISIKPPHPIFYDVSNMEYIKKTIAENFGGSSHSLVNEKDYFDIKQVPDLTGKVAVVTGGSEGIGFGATHTMLSKNVSKLFVCAACCTAYPGTIDLAWV